MAYEDKNGTEIKEIIIDANKLIELFNKAGEDAQKPNSDILDILTNLERAILDAQPKKGVIG